jgi:hypothetical protein
MFQMKPNSPGGTTRYSEGYKSLEIEIQLFSRDLYPSLKHAILRDCLLNSAIISFNKSKPHHLHQLINFLVHKTDVINTRWKSMER